MLDRVERDLVRDIDELGSLYLRKLGKFVEECDKPLTERTDVERQLNQIEFLREQKLRNLEKVRRIRKDSLAYSLGVKTVEVGIPVLGVLGAAYLKERESREKHAQ